MKCETDDLRLCKNCRHYWMDWQTRLLGWEWSECHAPQNMAVNLVTGNNVVSGASSCKTQRYYETGAVCRQEGRWYEPKRGKVGACWADSFFAAIKRGKKGGWK